MEAVSEHQSESALETIEPERRRGSRRKRKGKVLVGRTTCKLCDKSLNYNSLTPHMKRYHPADDDIPYSCAKYGCSEQFVTLAERHRHYLAMHSHEPEQRDRSVSKTLKMPVSRLYKPAYFSARATRYCHLCGKRCVNRAAFRRHRNEQCPGHVPDPPSKNAKDSGHSAATKPIPDKKKTDLEQVNRQYRRAIMAAEGIMEYPDGPSTSSDRRSVSPVIASSKLHQAKQPSLLDQLRKRRAPPIFEPDDPLMMYVASDDDDFDENNW